TRPRLSPELLRGRCLRALGGRTPAERVRVGARRGGAPGARQLRRGRPPAATRAAGRRRPASADVRRCMGVDALSLCALSGIRAAPGSARGIQRQVHGEPTRAEGRFVPVPAVAHPCDVPELLPARRTLADERPTPRNGYLRWRARSRA